MSDEDLPLNIPIGPIQDFFNCPICMCQLKTTFITMCGHRFCEKCVRETVDRHHRCPCCNNNLTSRDYYKDAQFDELIATINKEKDKAEKQYFDTLITTASSAVAMETGDKENEPVQFTSVELVLKKHLKFSMLAHQRYYQDLRKSFQRQLDQIRSECQAMTDDLNTQGLAEQELTQQISDLKQTEERKAEALKEDLRSCEQMVANAYDRYLIEHIPTLAVLPISLSINMLDKNIRIPSLQIKPQDRLEDIKQVIEEFMEKRGDKIVEFSPDVKFVYFGPFSKRSQYEMQQIASSLVELGGTHPDICILPQGSRPLLQFSLKPNGEIAVYGHIKCESDLPKQCFMATFQPGKALTVDYFSCKDCSFNWVCRPCMEVCHKDHNVVPYIMNHQPTWACCYCPKKKKCVIRVS